MADEIPGSWCDKVASTPSIGVTMGQLPPTSNSLLERMAPLFSWAQKYKFRSKIMAQETYKLELSGPEGFNYGVVEGRVHIEFKHSVTVKAKSGGLPTMEMVTKPLPYTQALAEARDRLIEFCNLIDPVLA